MPVVVWDRKAKNAFYFTDKNGKAKLSPAVENKVLGPLSKVLTEIYGINPLMIVGNAYLVEVDEHFLKQYGKDELENTIRDVEHETHKNKDWYREWYKTRFGFKPYIFRSKYYQNLLTEEEKALVNKIKF